MKCKFCWIVAGVVALTYSADAVYPDWQDYSCTNKSILGVQTDSGNTEAMNALKGRHLHAPKVAGCKFIPENKFRGLFA